MSNPQQPDLAASRTNPAQDADGPVPPENQAGHHPAEEQDKPDVDKFAAKLGTMEPNQREGILEESHSTPAPAPAAKRNALVGVGALVALILALVAGRRIRARR